MTILLSKARDRKRSHNVYIQRIQKSSFSKNEINNSIIYVFIY